jgi:hypothetical protein
MTSLQGVFGAGFDMQAAASQGNTGSFEPIPAGVYPLEVSNCELKQSRAGNPMIACSFTVTEGQYVNRKIFMNYNVGHPSEKPRLIAQQQFARLCLAAGFQAIQDDTQLIGARVMGRVGVRPPANGYDASNTIFDFQPMAQTTTAAPRVQQRTQQAVPWGRR